MNTSLRDKLAAQYWSLRKSASWLAIAASLAANLASSAEKSDDPAS